MKIRGAVLERIGDGRPFADSTPITVCELDLDEPGAKEVLVRMEVASICHSDLSVLDGSRPRPVPMLLGHEGAGIVEQTGGEVTGLPLGTRVVMTFLPRCGVCAGCRTDGIRPCMAGSASNEQGTLLEGERRLSRNGQPVHHHLGVSGFATHAVVDQRSLVPVAADIPPVVASLLGCAVLTGGGAVLNVGRPRPGQRVAIVGLGGVGMAALITALACEDVEVLGIDGIDAKLDQAAALGAVGTFRPEDALAQGIRADVVIEAAGHPTAFETAVILTEAGGITVSVGLPSPQARSSISPLALVAGGRSIIGSYLGSAVPRRDIPVLVDLWRSGRLPVESLVSATLDLADINAAMDHLSDGLALRQIISFEGARP